MINRQNTNNLVIITEFMCTIIISMHIELLIDYCDY